MAEDMNTLHSDSLLMFKRITRYLPKITSTSDLRDLLDKSRTLANKIQKRLDEIDPKPDVPV